MSAVANRLPKRNWDIEFYGLGPNLILPVPAALAIAKPARAAENDPPSSASSRSSSSHSSHKSSESASPSNAIENNAPPVVEPDGSAVSNELPKKKEGKKAKGKSAATVPAVAPEPAQLLLGGGIDAMNLVALTEQNVRVVINLVPKHVDSAFKAHFEYHTFQIEDEDEQDITHLFDTVYDIIATQIQRGPSDPQRGAVFIHCLGGISRSASLVIAFCMRHFQWSYDQALTHVHICRKAICPNDGFVKQLKAYEKILQADKAEDSSGKSCGCL